MKLLLHLTVAVVASLLICVGISFIYHDLLFLSDSMLKQYHEQHPHKKRNAKSMDDSKIQKKLSQNHHINNLRTAWGSTEFIQKHEHFSAGGDNSLFPIIAPERNEVLAIKKHNHHFRRRWRQRKHSRGWGRSGKGFILNDDGSWSTKRSPKSKVGRSRLGMSKGKGGSNRCGGSSKKSAKKGSSKKDGKGKGGGKGFERRSGKGKGDFTNDGKGKGKGKGKWKGKGKGKGKGLYSLDFHCETYLDDDIGLAAPQTATTIAPVLSPTNAPERIVTPSTSPSTLAPVTIATTSQPTVLVPTSSTMRPTPERGLIRIRVSNWYIAYRAPDATTRAPTRMEYDAILESTRLYVENYFLNYFQTNMLDMIRYVGSESLLTTASYGTDVPPFVQQPSPSDNGRFNIYIHFRYIEFIYYDTSTPIPDEAQSYDLLQSALLNNPDEQTYIMEVPQILTNTPFESTIDIVFGTVP